MTGDVILLATCAGSLFIMSLGLVIVLCRMMAHLERTYQRPINSMERILEKMAPDRGTLDCHSTERQRDKSPLDQVQLREVPGVPPDDVNFGM